MTPALLKDINVIPGVVSSSLPTNFVEFKGSAYFTAADAFNGSKLWKSDGTSTGRALVTTFAQSSPKSIFNDLTTVGNSVYSLATNGSSSYNLYLMHVFQPNRRYHKALNGTVPTFLTIEINPRFLQIQVGTPTGR